MLFDQNMIIDATTKGSIARFVNHSCNPNCRMEKWTVSGKPRMALFAGDRGIMTGEELTYDYNFDPFSQKNVQECHCGEPQCRGFLGPKQKKEERKSEEKENAQPKSPKKSLKRKMVEAVEEVVERVTKKQKTESSVVKAKTRVYATATSPAKKSSALGAKVKAAAKAVRGGSSSPMKASSGLARNPSKLKRMVQSTKEATSKARASASAGIQKSSSTKRIVSSTSATEALIEKEVSEEKTSKNVLVKSKIGSMKSTDVKTVRGRESGRSRTMRVIDGEL
jgi:[histone H3]-lysine4 N-trimethyltransferase ASH1L